MFQKISLTNIVLLGVCLLFAFLYYKGCNGKDDGISQEMYDASQDSLHKTINSLGQEETKTKLLVGSVDDLKKLSSSKDSSIQRLIKLVNKKTISASVISNTTSNTTSSATISHARDTIRGKGKDSLIYIYPEYTKRDSNKWEQIYAKANKDSFTINYKIFNEFAFKQEWEKQKVKGKLFKQKVAMAKITNLNPHTETRELKSFVVEPPKQKRLGIGASVGYGLSFGENKVSLRPSLNFSLNYNIFQF